MFKISWVNNYQHAWWLTSNNLAVLSRVVQHDWMFLQELCSLDLEKRKESWDLSEVERLLQKDTGLMGFTFVSPSSCSLASEVVSRTCCWVSSLTAFAWSVAKRTRYIHAYRTFLYQRSFRFLAERHKMLAKPRTRRRNDRSHLILLGVVDFDSGVWFPAILPILKFFSHSEKRKPKTTERCKYKLQSSFITKQFFLHKPQNFPSSLTRQKLIHKNI